MWHRAPRLPAAGHSDLENLQQAEDCSNQTLTWHDDAHISTASRSCGSDTAHTRHWSCVMITFACSSASLRQLHYNSEIYAKVQALRLNLSCTMITFARSSPSLPLEKIAEIFRR